MQGGRGYLGWMAATTVAITLSLVFLAVEKHIRMPKAGGEQIAAKPSRATSELAGSSAKSGQAELTVQSLKGLEAKPPAAPKNHEQAGIVLNLTPSLEGQTEYPRTDRAPIARPEGAEANGVAELLRRPPEPAANVVLQAPIATTELAQLPLHATSSGIDYLMDAMDEAFDRPMHTVSASRPSLEAPSFPMLANRLQSLPSPASITGRIPEPKALYEELFQLQQIVDPRFEGRTSQLVTRRPYIHVTPNEALSINHWIVEVQTILNRLTVQHGLEHAASGQDIRQLAQLSSQATQIGNTLSDYELAARLIRVGYAVQRRVAVWHAIQSCLDGTTIALSRPRSPAVARDDLIQSISAVKSKLTQTGDGVAWQQYLMLDELETWAQSSDDIWAVGNELARKVLSRLNWQRLTEAQQNFLAQPEFEELQAHLVVWGRDAVDYRQLITELEQLEMDPISRVGNSLAGTVQVLRLSDVELQQEVAKALNDHYRNANIRLSLSGELLERFLPDGEYEMRPVRQRILGADTRGDSAVSTKLGLRLIPDATAWNVDVGVTGDLYSNTRSTKGPAVFHNTSTAHIISHRYIRLDPMGYQVTAEPTSVASQDYLRRMSTDFDGLPVIGDFVRLMVREQFDQKRGLAQRITRRLIASEADTELDRRLDEALSKAEVELKERLVGPLENLNLNPMVVSMNTTDKRLTIRYRVANPTQLAAYTPRPRAPTGSLMSMQINQSTINNAIAQIGLSGKNWTLAELYSRLGEVFQQNEWKLPDDIPDDITVRFADHRPATVELKDGRLRLTLRIAELKQPGRLHIQRFLVSSNYIPVADGLEAELIRDGVVEIVSNRDRLPLRLIFAKVFVSRPEIPLISQSWQTDPRSEGLAVSQLDIRDGWLAVAISSADSDFAKQVAGRARALKMQ